MRRSYPVGSVYVRVEKPRFFLQPLFSSLSGYFPQSNAAQRVTHPSLPYPSAVPYGNRNESTRGSGARENSRYPNTTHTHTHTYSRYRIGVGVSLSQLRAGSEAVPLLIFFSFVSPSPHLPPPRSGSARDGIPHDNFSPSHPSPSLHTPAPPSKSSKKKR